MEINLRRCYFHSIVPLRRKNTLFNFEESQFERLRLMLKSGYIYPGNKLGDIITEEFDDFYGYGNDSVFLAQHVMSELSCYGGSFHNGEFSAYLEHIVANPSWVFSEHIVEGLRIENRNHMLSEEVCVQEPIDLHEAIAIMLPYETPSTKIRRFLQYQEYKMFEDTYKDEISYLLSNMDELLKEVYLHIRKWQEELKSAGYDIPCINKFGMELGVDKEKNYILENEESIKKLMKK